MDQEQKTCNAREHDGQASEEANPVPGELRTTPGLARCPAREDTWTHEARDHDVQEDGVASISEKSSRLIAEGDNTTALSIYDKSTFRQGLQV